MSLCTLEGDPQLFLVSSSVSKENWKRYSLEEVSYYVRKNHLHFPLGVNYL